jgi:hypothetical protein
MIVHSLIMHLGFQYEMAPSTLSVQVDSGFWDVITPARVTTGYRTLLDGPAPKIAFLSARDGDCGNVRSASQVRNRKHADERLSGLYGALLNCSFLKQHRRAKDADRLRPNVRAAA